MKTQKMPKFKNVVLKTERLILRKQRMSDTKALVKLNDDKEGAKFISTPYPYKLSDAKKFLKRENQNYGKTTYGFFIIDKKTKELIGSIAITDISGYHNFGEIGYYVRKDFRNKGIVTEACKAVLNFGFGKLKLHRIIICHARGNNASKKVILKLGIKYEGIEREARKIKNNGYVDALRYSILAKEWKNKSKKLR